MTALSYGNILKKVIYPLWWTYVHKEKPKLFDYYRDLTESQFYSKKEIEEFQFFALKNMLEHAYKNVPYYKNKFDKCGFKVKNFDSPEQLAKIPVMTKQDLKKYYNNELLAKNISKSEMTLSSTSGSTGSPTFFYQDHTRNVKNLAMAMRSDNWAGWDLDKKKANFWNLPGLEINERSQFKFFVNKIKQAVLDNLLDRYNIYIDPKALGAKDIELQIQALYSFQPDIIFGYVTPIYFLAKHIKYHNLPKIKPTSVLVTAETLDDKQKLLISDIYESPVFVRYAAREAGTMAMQCDKSEHLHINFEHTFIEIVDDDCKPAHFGQEGKIVITDLINYAMPLIRYNIEDLSSFVDTECECGRYSPSIARPLGRVSDVFKTPDGRCFHGSSINIFIFNKLENIERFQVYQHKLDEVVVKIVKNQKCSEEDIEWMKIQLQDIFGNDVRIEFILTDSISILKSGKYRYYISDVS